MHVKPHKMNLHPRQVAYTMTELLIVISVIAILAGLLIPAINSIRSSAKKADCMNRHRQTAASIFIYCHNNKGRFPSWMLGSETWYTLISEDWIRNLGTNQYNSERVAKLLCPEDPNLPERYTNFQKMHLRHYFSIGYNDVKLDTKRLVQVNVPTSTILLGDTMMLSPTDPADVGKGYGFARVWYNTAHESALYPRHTNGMITNVAMVDGRVTSIKAHKPYDYQSLYRSTSMGGTGIIPDGSESGDGTTWWDP